MPQTDTLTIDMQRKHIYAAIDLFCEQIGIERRMGVNYFESSWYVDYACFAIEKPNPFHESDADAAERIFKDLADRHGWSWCIVTHSKKQSNRISVTLQQSQNVSNNIGRMS